MAAPIQRAFNLSERRAKGLPFFGVWFRRIVFLLGFLVLWFQVVNYGDLMGDLSPPSEVWTNQTTSTLSAASSPHKNRQKKLKLRFDWSNLSPSLDLTQQFVAHQNDCSLPQGTFVYRNRYGLGSDLHIWGQAMCNGMATGIRIRTVGNWSWLDTQLCSRFPPSTMTCYFPKSELNCPGDVDYAMAHPQFEELNRLSKAKGTVKEICQQNLTKGVEKGHQRMAALEYLFLNVSPAIIKEAERQLNLIFGERGDVPKDLIVVHIRWGDKYKEMTLVTAKKYVQAVTQILEERGRPLDKANVYLATEDPVAVKEFQKSMPAGWNLYLDQFYVDMLPYRKSEYNGAPKMSKELDGRAGSITLGSLLVAMEANDFVLTTASNWSRLMNELRKTILDSRCGNCTKMIDLRPPKKGEW